MPPPDSFERKFKYEKYLEMSREKEEAYSIIQDRLEKQRLSEEKENQEAQKNLRSKQQNEEDEDDYWFINDFDGFNNKYTYFIRLF